MLGHKTQSYLVPADRRIRVTGVRVRGHPVVVVAPGVLPPHGLDLGGVDLADVLGGRVEGTSVAAADHLEGKRKHILKHVPFI